MHTIVQLLKFRQDVKVNSLFMVSSRLYIILFFTPVVFLADLALKIHVVHTSSHQVEVLIFSSVYQTCHAWFLNVYKTMCKSIWWNGNSLGVSGCNIYTIGLKDYSTSSQETKSSSETKAAIFHLHLSSGRLALIRSWEETGGGILLCVCVCLRVWLQRVSPYIIVLLLNWVLNLIRIDQPGSDSCILNSWR